MMPEWLFYGGLCLCGISVVFAVLAIVLFHIGKKRLEQQLDLSYGKRGPSS